MSSTDKNRVIVQAIVHGGLTQVQAADRFEVSTRWIRTLMTRYNQGGLEAVGPRSRRPHSTPHATPAEVVEQILHLRSSLQAQGLDAGAQSIWDRLPPRSRPSPATIWRILTREGQITPQPQKRPRSSWHRFQAHAPNGCWQSDVTEWALADGSIIEIISWLDDHSRKLLHITPHTRVTGAIVIDTFTTTMDHYGPPASTLTDNGMIYTARFARGNDGTRGQPNGFEQLLADLNIEQKNGRPARPTTQGKIERFHQTLKRWLRATGPAPTLTDLAHTLEQFQQVYNTQRPHRAINRRTPKTAYHALPRAAPTIEIDRQLWRTRYDRINTNGTITLRYAGKLRHLGIGRAHTGTRAIVLLHGNQTMVVNPATGQILAEHTIDPNKNYQPKKPERSPETTQHKPER